MVAAVPLSQDYIAYVDDADAEAVRQFRWHIKTTPSGRLYAQRSVFAGGRWGTELLHRFLLGLPAGDRRVADHIDNNGLNNVRSNLRICTHQQNMWNRIGNAGSASKLKGVHARGERFFARIRLNGRDVYLGGHATAEAAARAYDRAALQHFGAFARTNFPAEAS